MHSSANDVRLMPGLRRRDALRLLGGAVAGGLAVPALGAPAAGADGVATATGPAPSLPEPEVLRSRAGLLEVTLHVTPVTVDVAGHPCRMLAYNGRVPGPTLVVAPGDLLRIRLVNGLDEPTNLHTHGLHVSGEGNADNISVRVGAGESFDYEIPVRADHQPGLHWYHPHVHGHSARQLFAGLYGALVVQGHGERHASTGIHRDRVLALSAVELDPRTHQLVDVTGSSQARQVPLLNGLVDPVIDIAPGETQRWRLVNASVNSVLRLSLEGHTMTRIAADGHPYWRPDAVEELTLAAGQRADVLVTGGRPGSADLRVLPYDIGFGVVVPARRLATLDCAGPPVPGPPVRPGALLRPLRDLRTDRVDVHRDVALTMAGGFGIDGRPFDPSRVDQVVELGAVEEWTVTNETGLVHPFHIHVNPYQVTHVDGEPVDALSWEDTALVPKQGGSITLRSHFQHFPGTALYHCHFVTHAELGMMGRAEVVAPAGRRR